MSGATSVRGGFDSHAFPPLLQRLAGLAGLWCALLCALAAPVRAAAPDTLAAPRVDVVRATRTRADSVRARPWHEQPRFVMARSLLIPGWGQFHNHAWLKAALVAGSEGYLASRIVQDQRALDGLLRDLDSTRARNDQVGELAVVNEYNDRLSQRLGRQWLLGAVVAFALIDAYVDAHFRGFDLEFKVDPALPDGPPPSPAPASGNGGTGHSLRLALRWDF